MEDAYGSMTPFSLQSNTTHRRANRHRRRSPSDFFLNSTVLIIILLVSAILFIFFIIPSLLSLTSQIFKPSLVKKSWDSLNLVLVLFAVVCGFLSRTNSDNASSSSSHEDQYVLNSSMEVQRSNSSSTTSQWYEYSDRTAYNSMSSLRSSSSYPDLRQESPWMSGDDRWRFFDDTQVNNYRFSESDDLHRRRRKREIEIEDSDTKSIPVDHTFVNRPTEVSFTPLDRSPPPPSPPAPAHPPPPPTTTVRHRAKRTAEDTKSIPVDTFVNRPTEVSFTPPHRSLHPSPPPPSTPAPAHPPPSPTTVRRKAKRTSETLARREKSENSDAKLKKLETPPTAPPPPLPLEVAQHWEQEIGKSDRKRGGATKDFFTSFYHQGKKKKKKQRQKSIENLDSILQPPPSSSSHLHPPPSPPPPPPPPPPSVFHNFFSSKKGKTKKIPSVPPTPPPPPPLHSTARVSKAKTQIVFPQSQANPVTTRRPPLPVKTSSFNSAEENTSSGSESPLNPIPPPPPLPPFKMPEWKFVVHGDFVRIKSNSSSRSGSPDLDDVGPSTQPTSTTAAMDDGDSPPPPSSQSPSMFCPSPDVNSKADTFIARFRAGLKLEKMNSIKQKQTMGLSNLGPERSPSPETSAGPGPSQI